MSKRTHEPSLAGNGENGGMRGGPLHQKIDNWLRFPMPEFTRDFFPWIEWMFVGDDGLAAILLRTQGKGGTTNNPKGGKGEGYYPDSLWMYKDSETGESGSLAIEVGKYEPDRAPEWVPVLHIGFTGRVSLINAPPDDSIAQALLEMFRMIIADSDSWGEILGGEARPWAILAW